MGCEPYLLLLIMRTMNFILLPKRSLSRWRKLKGVLLQRLLNFTRIFRSLSMRQRKQQSYISQKIVNIV